MIPGSSAANTQGRAQMMAYSYSSTGSSNLTRVHPWSQGDASAVAADYTGNSASPSNSKWSPSGDLFTRKIAATPHVDLRSYDTKLRSFGSIAASPSPVPSFSASTLVSLHSAIRTTSNCIAVTGSSLTNGVTAYNLTSGAFGTQITAPATVVANARWTDWNPGGTSLGVTTVGTPYINVYNWSTNAFGSKMSNPATLPTASGITGSWTRSGGHLAMATGLAQMHVYPVTTSIGTRVSDPSTLPSTTLVSDVGSQRHRISFSPDDKYIALSGWTNSTAAWPNIYIYNWTGTSFGTKIADHATTVAAEGVSAFAWSEDMNSIVIRFGPTNASIFSYKWSSSGFGTRASVSNLASNTVNVTSISFLARGKI